MIHVEKSLKKAEQKYSAAEQMRRREDLLEEVNRLSRAGVSHDTIAELMGMNVRQVVRMCNGQVAEPKPPQRYNFSTQATRVNRLEAMADAALTLAFIQRDEDPQIVWDTLMQLDRHALQELTAVALAAIPVDMPKSQIFAWVEEMAL